MICTLGGNHMPDHAYLRTHVLKAENLVLDLVEAAAELRARSVEADRQGVTLVREGGLSVVLTHLRAGSALQEHAAPGPVTVQVLDGRVRFTIGDDQLEASSGRLVAFDAGVRHGVEAIEDSTLLLTLGAPHDE